MVVLWISITWLIVVFGDEFLAQGCIYSHTRGVKLGLGLGFMQTSQVLPHWLNQSFSFWTLPYTQRHCHVRIEKSPVQTVAIILEWFWFYQSIRARSTRLLNSFFPQAVRALNSDHPRPPLKPHANPPPPPITKHPPTLPHQRKKTELCAIQVCYTQVSGPVQTTCSNTLSSMH